MQADELEQSVLEARRQRTAGAILFHGRVGSEQFELSAVPPSDMSHDTGFSLMRLKRFDCALTIFLSGFQTDIKPRPDLKYNKSDLCCVSAGSDTLVRVSCL